MADFFGNFFLVVSGAFFGGILAGVFIISQIKKHFFRPKLFFKNIRIDPTKGEVSGDKFKWGGLIFTSDLCNDSEYWAYNVRIQDIYAEFLPNSKVKLLSHIPLRLATDLPRIENYQYYQKNAQLQNIKPGDKISTSIRIITRKELSLYEYKRLIKELKMIQIRTRLVYENSSGYKSGTYFWLDFQYARYINLFANRISKDNIWKNGMEEMKSKVKIRSKIIEIEAEPF